MFIALRCSIMFQVKSVIIKKVNNESIP